MDAQKAKKLEVEASMTKGAEGEKGSFSEHITKSHEKFGDRREKVVSARTHFYENEMACDVNMGECGGTRDNDVSNLVLKTSVAIISGIFMDSIDAVAGTTGGTGFAAIKITALGKPKLLLNISEVLVKSKQHYQKSSQSAMDKVEVMHTMVNFSHNYSSPS